MKYTNNKQSVLGLLSVVFLVQVSSAGNCGSSSADKPAQSVKPAKIESVYTLENQATLVGLWHPKRSQVIPEVKQEGAKTTLTLFLINTSKQLQFFKSWTIATNTGDKLCDTITCYNLSLLRDCKTAYVIYNQQTKKYDQLCFGTHDNHYLDDKHNRCERKSPLLPYIGIKQQ